IRGNLLAIPIEDSLLYVEPIFLQAEQSDLPELTRVIVAHGEMVVMQPTLEAALAQIFGADAVARAFPEVDTEEVIPELPGVGAGTGLRDLAREAEDVYRQAQDRLRAGDWAGYGEAIDRLGQLIRQIAESAPAEPMSPAPLAAPDGQAGPAAEGLGATAPPTL